MFDLMPCMSIGTQYMNMGMQYMEVAFPTATPEWATENTIVLRHPAFLLRRFREEEGETTLEVNPQAGHHSCIGDFDKGQSLIETIVNTRRGSVYAIEWLSCTQERKDEDIDDLVDQILAALAVTGPCHIIGLCQGGWLSAIVAGMYQELILSLTDIAGPIDMKIGGGMIQEALAEHGLGKLSKEVDDNNGIMSGKFMLMCWKMSHPVERYWGDYADIYTDVLLGNDKKLKKVKRFRTWYEYTQDLAGASHKQISKDLFYKNLLIKGELIVKGRVVKLSDITCPVVMIAGELDDITLEAQVFALGDYVSSTELYYMVIPKCGHIGCFMGSKSQPYLADSIIWVDRQMGIVH